MVPVPAIGLSSVASRAETAPSPQVVECERPSRFSIRPRRSLLFVAFLLLLHGTNPLCWGANDWFAWFPPAGLGLTLIAWFGPRAAVAVAMDGLLVVVQALLLGRLRGNMATGVAVVDAVVGPAFLALAWHLYQPARGGRDLRDPHAAKRFLFLVPCLGVGMWAAVDSLTVAWPEASIPVWQAEFLAFWLPRALGVMVLTPLALVVLTPWLAQCGLVRMETEDDDSLGFLNGIGDERFTSGDGLELFGLALASSALTWLAVQNGRAHPMSWHLWGAPLLLIVWAGLRQGVRGATLVASISAFASLLLSESAAITLVVQVNLLGQCAVALLVAASANSVRISEERYRQVARHLPVVLYSARFRQPQRPPLNAADCNAEVTLVSAASERLLGCSPRRLLGDHERWLAHVHSEDRELLRAALAQLGRQVQPVTCEYRLQTEAQNPETGEANETPRRRRWMRDTLAPHLDSMGRLIGWEGVVMEITEQRELADDLRRITSMLHALVGNLPAGVFFVQGPLGQPILVNARARQLLGQREDTAAGLEHLAEVYRLHRADGSLYPVEELPVYQALRKGLPTMRDDIIVHRPDGRRTPLVTWAAPVTLAVGGRGSTNNPEAAVWVLEDLTALHQAEAARRDTEIRLRAILETMCEGVVVQDQSGYVLDCNNAACVLLGHPPERLRGLSLAECDWRLLREDGSPLAKEEYPAAEVLRLGRPVRNRVLALVPRGMGAEIEERQFKELRWVLVNAMPLGADSGGETRARGVVSTYIDITTTIQARRSLRESEEKYRDLVESLPIMVIVSDTDSRVIYANAATSQQTGYELSEIAEPEAWSRLVHPDDIPRLQTLAQEALLGHSGRAEYRYRAKDGSEKVGLAFSEPRRRADGVILGATTLIADMTRERQLEQELLRAQRLELVGRLSSGIAHDFNNLLSVVLSLTELVTMSLPNDHAAQNDLARIQEATEQAAGLASQLLSFGKQRHIAARRIDINSIAARTLELLRATLPSRIELRAELDEQQLFVLADETQVQQVLMNLCLNARDAMPDGGLLRVWTERIAHEGDWVRLSVCDSGTGISEAVKAHLFDPFYSTKERGTGLGLAVVRQIVESHGGRVEATSTAGQGACFEVWWPTAT